jgi:hypothetical protein
MGELVEVVEAELECGGGVAGVDGGPGVAALGFHFRPGDFVDVEKVFGHIDGVEVESDLRVRPEGQCLAAEFGLILAQIGFARMSDEAGDI